MEARICDWCGEGFTEKDKAGRQRFCSPPRKCKERWWAYHRPVARVKVRTVRKRRNQQSCGNSRRVTRLVYRLAGEWLGEQQAVLYGIAPRHV